MLKFIMNNQCTADIHFVNNISMFFNVSMLHLFYFSSGLKGTGTRTKTIVKR